MKKTVALAATMTLLLSACGPPRDDPKTSPPAPASTHPAGAENQVYTDALRGFSLVVPADMQVRHDFGRSYLDEARWKAFAATDSQGTPVVALVLKGSNHITTAALRIGVSTAARALANCTQMPDNGMASGRDTVKLGGADFVHFHAGDAAMSHYLQVEGYRTVHAGRCYAIDLWISGTRPEVYDPPATPPFTNQQAQRALHQALAGFRFSR